MTFHRLFLGLLAAALACGALAQGSSTRGSQGLSQGSEASMAASGVIVSGSVQVLQGGSQLVVTGLEAAGESVVIVLKGASEAVTVSVKTSAQLAREAS